MFILINMWYQLNIDNLLFYSSPVTIVIGLFFYEIFIVKFRIIWYFIYTRNGLIPDLTFLIVE